MRLIHTADWHLGRIFHGISLIDDQAHVLASLEKLIASEKPDALIIAGDVYDRAVPPADAVRLLDQTLNNIVIGLKTPVLMIAGNHDSAERLGFASAMLESRGLHVRGQYADTTTPVTLSDEHGPVDFCLLPYEQAMPSRYEQSALAETTSPTGRYDAAMALTCDIALSACQSPRRVGIAHCFAAGGSVSDSERPLSVGGSDQVSAARFKEFNYVALGHLHRPQRAADNVYYSGSLLKYSFSEAGHNKSVSLIDIQADGAFTRTEIELDIRRDVRIVEDTLDSLLEKPEAHGDVSDYLLARLTDRGALYDPLSRLRAHYPNILQIERTALFTSDGNLQQTRAMLKRDDSDLFSSFFKDVTGDELSPQEATALESAIRTMRESGAES